MNYFRHCSCLRLVSCGLQVTSVEDVPPPLVEIRPTNQTLPLHSVATLSCQARGSPPPRIKWYKNGSPLDSPNSRLLVKPSGSLHIDGENPLVDLIFVINAVFLMLGRS